MKFISVLISTLLSVLLLFNTLRVSLTFTYYKVDPVGFIERLCENKDKPELKCNGKCHLKKVTQQENSDNELPNELIDFKEVILYYHHNKTLLFELKYSYTNPTLVYFNLYSFLHEQQCFHPPKNKSSFA